MKECSKMGSNMGPVLKNSLMEELISEIIETVYLMVMEKLKTKMVQSLWVNSKREKSMEQVLGL